MGLYESIADLPLRVDSYSLAPLVRPSNSWTRHTTVFTLAGAGHEGVGEDVIWDEDDQSRQIALGPVLDLSGSWTLDSFSKHLDEIDLFPGGPPAFDVYGNYRRWALESAGADLALRQAGLSLADALGRTHEPLRFVVSIGLGTPPSIKRLSDRLDAYPDMRFKLDARPDWTPELIDAVAATGSVDVIDFKGAYKGTSVDVETDAVLYEAVAKRMPGVLLEDPDLDPEDARRALEDHMDRVTWDAVIHSVDDVPALPHTPRTLNCKPSRFGSWEALLAFYEYCDEAGIALYAGGQSELGPGRGQAQLLASLMHPEAPNDIAPSGLDQDSFPRDLPGSRLEPAAEATGFRRRP